MEFKCISINLTILISDQLSWNTLYVCKLINKSRPYWADQKYIKSKSPGIMWKRKTGAFGPLSLRKSLVFISKLNFWNCIVTHRYLWTIVNLSPWCIYFLHSSVVLLYLMSNECTGTYVFMRQLFTDTFCNQLSQFAMNNTKNV